MYKLILIVAFSAFIGGIAGGIVNSCEWISDKIFANTYKVDVFASR